MKNPPPSCRPHRNQGVALVLVLCFIVLVTGLVVAYFSRAVTTRQLSNASTSTTQADALANSATDVILSDLKVEIANGSIAAPPPAPAAAAASTVYAPMQAAYAVPQRNPLPAATPATAPAPAVGPMPNLVRRSLRQDAAGGTNAAPAPAPTPGSRASAVASDVQSSNGRYISKARWNRHYLLPTATPAASAIPAGSSASLAESNPVPEFTAPDWVFVTAEKGPAVLSSPSKDASGAAVTATGRYAYAIYDEGGLLDINYAGYPSTSTPNHVGAKYAPSYADLTQLPPPTATTPVLTRENIDNLLGWRNYATLQATDAFPALKPSASADTAYYNLFASSTAVPNLTNPTLLQVPLTLWKDKTDQRFLSRQQLINYFVSAKLDPKYLQYFGTFSRSLNQPSYLPEHSPLTLDPIRPPVLIQNRGGNDSYGNADLTPNFLTARVATTFKRYDQTDALVGETLLKKRFPLNRLAWLTYKGPSSKRNTSATALTGPDADIGYLKQNGITKEWLDQGNDANILLYFGLRWDATTKWTYSHGVNGSDGAILNISNPNRPIDVVRQSPGREPDFFEILKGAINPGSIAKASLGPAVLTTDASTMHAAQDQYKLDASLDIAILQIGANIIDQSDADGFPTQIKYSSLGIAGANGTVYGDENLPYISRVRSGLLHLVKSKPDETIVEPGIDIKPGIDPVTGASIPVPVPVIDTGVAALMNYPEVWNPHGWNSSTTASANGTNPLAQSVGAVAPSNFKIYAETNKTGGLRQATTLYVWNENLHHNSIDANKAKSPGFEDTYKFNFGVVGSAPPRGGEARYLCEKNTVMTFVINRTSAATETLFREPTLLFTPGFPTGSQLASPSLVATNNGGAVPEDGLGNLAKNPGFFGGGGLISAAGSSAGGNGIPIAGNAYVGFYIGAQPMRWWDDNKDKPYKAGDPTTGPKNYPHYQTQFGPVNDVTYTLACEDGMGGTILYDSKPITTTGQPNAKLSNAVDFCSGFNGNSDLDFGTRYYQTIDPRTSRFGMVDPWISANSNSIPPRKASSTPNLAQLKEGVFATDREGANAGTGLWLNLLSTQFFSATMGWYHDNDLYSHDAFRLGLLTQNDPNVVSDGKISTVLASYVGTGPYYPFYYADADGVVRRASGGNVEASTAPPVPASSLTGLPMAYARGTLSNGTYSSGATARQMDSRPSILNRPFRSVAELGYVYSGTPWKNLDFFLPESGNSALLDVFCVNDSSDSNALTAGQVNLNTRQVPVLQAILAQTSKDQWNDANLIPGGAAKQAQQLAQLLVNRTATKPTSGPNVNNGPQPLQNVSDLVGRWVSPVNVTTGFAGIDGKASCDGFATDVATFTATSDLTMHNVQRFGESAVRALANAGQTRVWNLMFDVVAQTGRFSAQAAKLDQFNVEGEQHYWVHVAIDRYTGQILDKQVEIVKE